MSVHKFEERKPTSMFAMTYARSAKGWACKPGSDARVLVAELSAEHGNQPLEVAS